MPLRYSGVGNTFIETPQAWGVYALHVMILLTSFSHETRNIVGPEYHALCD